MVLSNVEIQRALDEGRLLIDPEPSPRFQAAAQGHCPYDTHSVDLRLAAEISVPLDDGVSDIDLGRPGKVAAFLHRNSQHHAISADRPFKLEKGKFILARTVERVGLPIPEQGDTCLAARIEGKSSRARFGLLIHFTAPTIHPGFDGTITLEMINLGNWPLILTPGMAIAQLIVEEVRGLPRANPSQFQGQNTAAGLPHAGQGT